MKKMNNQENNQKSVFLIKISYPASLNYRVSYVYVEAVDAIDNEKNVRRFLKMTPKGTDIEVVEQIR